MHNSRVIVVSLAADAAVTGNRDYLSWRASPLSVLESDDITHEWNASLKFPIGADQCQG